MTGRGSAHAAVSLLNATATGHGCSIAIRGGVRATWQWREDPRLVGPKGVDDNLARNVRDLIAPGRGGTWTSKSTFPPQRGLKTSSSAAAALVRAASDDRGSPMPDDAVCRLGAEANLRAGVSITGAFDDQCAVTLGGCHLTDNPKRAILMSIPVPAWRVAVWVPEATVAKAAVAKHDPTGLAAEAEAVEALIRSGDLAEAMTRNGEAFCGFYKKHGLPVDAAPAKVALDAGALGAGLSGTGPATAALFHEEVQLAPVPGGTWVWSETMPQGSAPEFDRA